MASRNDFLKMKDKSELGCPFNKSHIPMIEAGLNALDDLIAQYWDTPKGKRALNKLAEVADKDGNLLDKNERDLLYWNTVELTYCKTEQEAYDLVISKYMDTEKEVESEMASEELSQKKRLAESDWLNNTYGITGGMDSLESARKRKAIQKQIDSLTSRYQQQMAKLESELNSYNTDDWGDLDYDEVNTALKSWRKRQKIKNK